MFLTDHYSIKGVLTFPFMKGVAENKEKAAEVVGIEPMPEGIRKSLLASWQSLKSLRY